MQEATWRSAYPGAAAEQLVNRSEGPSCFASRAATSQAGAEQPRSRVGMRRGHDGERPPGGWRRGGGRLAALMCAVLGTTLVLMGSSHLVARGGGGPRLRISMRRSKDGEVVAPVRSGAAEEFFSRVHAENAPHLQEDVDAGAAESVTGAARPRDVMGGDRTDGALVAGAGQRPDPSKGDHEVYEFPEPADNPEAFLRRARGALERSNPNSVQALVEEQRPSGSGFSARGGDGEPSREFANAASSLLDEGLDDEGAGEAAQDAGVEEVPAEAEPTGEDVGPAQLEEEYDYEHFWDHAAAEDAPPEDELEHALEHARSKFSEQDAAGSAVTGNASGEVEGATEEMAELLAEMLPSEAAAATATAKGTAAALIVAEYARASANRAESKAHIVRAATNPQDLLNQLSPEAREAAMADAEAAAADIIRAAHAQSKQAREARTKLADAWRQLPDGGWRREGPRTDSPMGNDVQGRADKPAGRRRGGDSNRLFFDNERERPEPSEDALGSERDAADSSGHLRDRGERLGSEDQILGFGEEDGSAEDMDVPIMAAREARVLADGGGALVERDAGGRSAAGGRSGEADPRLAESGAAGRAGAGAAANGGQLRGSRMSRVGARERQASRANGGGDRGGARPGGQDPRMSESAVEQAAGREPRVRKSATQAAAGQEPRMSDAMERHAMEAEQLGGGDAARGADQAVQGNPRLGMSAAGNAALAGARGAQRAGAVGTRDAGVTNPNSKAAHQAQAGAADGVGAAAELDLADDDDARANAAASRQRADTNAARGDSKASGGGSLAAGAGRAADAGSRLERPHANGHAAAAADDQDSHFEAVLAGQAQRTGADVHSRSKSLEGASAGAVDAGQAQWSAHARTNELAGASTDDKDAILAAMLPEQAQRGAHGQSDAVAGVSADDQDAVLDAVFAEPAQRDGTLSDPAANLGRGARARSAGGIAAAGAAGIGDTGAAGMAKHAKVAEGADGGGARAGAGMEAASVGSARASAHRERAEQLERTLSNAAAAGNPILVDSAHDQHQLAFEDREEPAGELVDPNPKPSLAAGGALLLQASQEQAALARAAGEPRTLERPGRVAGAGGGQMPADPVLEQGGRGRADAAGAAQQSGLGVRTRQQHRLGVDMQRHDAGQETLDEDEEGKPELGGNGRDFVAAALRRYGAGAAGQGGGQKEAARDMPGTLQQR